MWISAVFEQYPHSFFAGCKNTDFMLSYRTPFDAISYFADPVHRNVNIIPIAKADMQFT